MRPGPKHAGLYTSGQAAKITGVSMRNIHYWTCQEVLFPSVAASGTGEANFYAIPDLLAVYVLAQFSAGRHHRGLSIEQKQQLAAEVRRCPGQNIIRLQLTDVVELAVNLAAVRSIVARRLGMTGGTALLERAAESSRVGPETSTGTERARSKTKTQIHEHAEEI